MKKDLAVVTMTYNERSKFPRWVDHYSKQVRGDSDLFVLDHGSTDSTVDNFEHLNVVRVPRDSHFTQAWRASLVSEFCCDLLRSYHYVLYTDTDEIVLADPYRFRSLLDYVTKAGSVSNSTIGFDVLHDVKVEPDLRSGPVTFQRKKLQFVASMCKPTLISRPTMWSAGFHTSSNEPKFGDLFLFHLRYADLREGKERLNVTRSISRPDMATVSTDHQKLSDDTFESWVRSWVNYPAQEEGNDIFQSEAVMDMVSSFKFKVSRSNLYEFDYSFRSKVIFIFPEKFMGIF